MREVGKPRDTPKTIEKAKITKADYAGADVELGVIETKGVDHTLHPH